MQASGGGAFFGVIFRGVISCGQEAAPVLSCARPVHRTGRLFVEMPFETPGDDMSQDVSYSRDHRSRTSLFRKPQEVTPLQHGEATDVLHVLTCISYGRRGTPSNQYGRTWSLPVSGKMYGTPIQNTWGTGPCPPIVVTRGVPTPIRNTCEDM